MYSASQTNGGHVTANGQTGPLVKTFTNFDLAAFQTFFVATPRCWTPICWTPIVVRLSTGIEGGQELAESCSQAKSWFTHSNLAGQHSCSMC